MADDSRVKELLARLCGEALADLEGDPARFFARAAPGKTIAQGATTISLSEAGVKTLWEIVDDIRSDPKFRTRLSHSEMEQCAISAMFRGAEAIEGGTLDPDELTEWLYARLSEGMEVWEVYLPVPGLKLPPGQELALAGGTFKKQLSAKEKSLLQDASKGEGPMTKFIEGAIASEGSWFHIRVEGRSGAASLLAKEGLALGIDMLLFWGLLVGKDPEQSALARTAAPRVEGSGSFQMTTRGDLSISYGPFDVRMPYDLDVAAFAKLTELEEFKRTQEISNTDGVEGAAAKVLLGMQQFAEAARLPSPTLKLVWYLSALETVLVKDKGEGNTHVKVARRLKNLLGEPAGDAVKPLYDKRWRPVHHGHRNRVSEEVVTESNHRAAMRLAYLGIIGAIGHWAGSSDHDALVDRIDRLDPPP